MNVEIFFPSDYINRILFAVWKGEGGAEIGQANRMNSDIRDRQT
jgi:hypothetical protein